MSQDSRYKIPSLERQINRLIGFIFYYRLAFVGVLLVIVFIFVLRISYKGEPYADLVKNASIILTCGSIITGIFYSIINYEHNYYKSQSDSLTAKRTLAFNVAFEWHKPNIVEHLKITKTMYVKHKHLIDENKSAAFSEMIEEDEAARASLISIFNYLESVSVGIQFGIMDHDLIKRCFKSLFITYFNDYNFYIIYRRKKNNCPEAWKNFTDLAERWIAVQN